MDKAKYRIIEEYMLSCMNDCDIVHDSQHIYRVLYNALDISKDYEVDEEVLIASSLLHDIGRNTQFKDSNTDHATKGAEVAYRYLISIGWSEDKANHVKDCISTHTYRHDNQPYSIEAKIVFDADKLDVVGAVGIARTIAYSGIVSQPLYSVRDNGQVLPGDNNEKASFFKEYIYDLSMVYDRFYTAKAKEIAEKRKKAGLDFYNSLFEEVDRTHKKGLDILDLILE